MLPSRRIVQGWLSLGPRFLPFADAATAEMPLSRLLRLSLFQVSVGMALALLVGTLNRVMIVELGVAAALVAVMVALPVVYAPLRALVGYRSDHHRSAFGWRRVPFIWTGTMLQFGGLAVLPFSLLVLSGGGDAGRWPSWIGPAGAGLAFLLIGAGLHTVQTAGLALATDQAAPEARPKVVGLMYVMLLVGTIVSAGLFGAFLREFSPGRLVQVIQAAALATLVLNAVALWKQEARCIGRPPERAPAEGFRVAWARHIEGDGTRRRLLAIALGTMAFGMQDVLLEPYGGHVLGMGVGATTWLTALLAAGGLVGFSLASRVLTRGFDPARMAAAGVMLGLPAFSAVLLAAGLQSVPIFALGVLAIGLAAGLFGHGTLTLTMNRAPRDQAGLALGAWGAAQATAAGVAIALGGVGRDLVDAVAMRGWLGESLARPVTGYAAVYAVELVLLVLTLLVLRGLVGAQRLPPAVGASPTPPAASAPSAPLASSTRSAPSAASTAPHDHPDTDWRPA